MKKLAALLAFLTAFACQGFSQIVLDDFNTGTATGAIVGGTSWVGQVTQNATTITIGGTAKDDNGWGTTSVNINGSSFSYLLVTGQVDVGNTGSNSFVIQFEDSALNTNIFSVPTSAFTSTMTTVPIAISWTGGFDATQITGWNIGGGSTGTFAWRMTLDNMTLATAVPEPSTYAMIAGVLALGFVAWRRRSVSA
jgi:hypothetical protein